MAAIDVLLEDYLKTNNITFEILIREIINRPETVSINDDILWGRLVKLTNSLTYWSNQMIDLIKPNRLILSTFDPLNSKRFDNTTIFKALYNIMDIKYITGIYYPQNTNYIGIDFSDINVLETVKKKMQMVDNLYIVNIVWGFVPKRQNIRLHWLPSDVPYEEVNLFMKQYFQDINMRKLKVRFVESVYIESNIIEAQAILKEDVKISNVPYITSIDGYSALINIRGRPPICLECREIGHIRNNCRYKYCKVCKAKVDKTHDCKDFRQAELFSDIVKSNIINNEKWESENNVSNDTSSIKSEKVKIVSMSSLIQPKINAKQMQSSIITYAVCKDIYKKKEKNNDTIDLRISELQKIANDLNMNKNQSDNDTDMDINLPIISQKRRHDQIEEEENNATKEKVIIEDKDIQNSQSDLELSPKLMDSLVTFSDTDY